VETWAMIVPWNGFPLSDLIAKVQPKSSARYIKFTTFEDPEIAPNQKQFPNNPWPYTEAITMEEGLNEEHRLLGLHAGNHQGHGEQ